MAGQLADISSAICDTSRTSDRLDELSTSGGTSDARFITHLCPVAEFGLVGKTMHKVDEHVSIDEIDQLTAIYLAMLSRFFEVAN